MRIQNKFYAVILFLFANATSYAVKEYYSLSRSIRALGMGNAFYGLSDDEYALFYNPAGLGFIRTDGQVMLNVNAQFAPKTLSAVSTLTSLGGSKDVSTLTNQLLQYQGTPLYFNVGLFPHFVTKRFAIGLLLADTKTDIAILGKDLDTSMDFTAISDTGLLVGYAHPFLEDKLSIGINVKGLLRAGAKKNFALTDIANSSQIDFSPEKIGGVGVGFDFDLGGMYELPNSPIGLVSRVGLTLNNLMASSFSNASIAGGKPPGLSRMVTLSGNTIFEGWRAFDNFNAVVDFAEFQLGGESDPDAGARTGSIWKHFNAGVEAPMNGWFIPRIGIHQGYWSAGFGLNLKIARLEFATYAEELSSAPGRLTSRRFAVKLALGGASSSPEPITSGEKKSPQQVPEEKSEKISPATPPASEVEKKEKSKP